MLALIFLLQNCSENGAAIDPEDAIKFTVGSVTMDPASPVRGDTVTFTARMSGNLSYIEEYRWRIVDVTSHISKDPEYKWVANVPAGEYILEIRPRSLHSVKIDSYWFTFEIHTSTATGQ